MLNLRRDTNRRREPGGDGKILIDSRQVGNVQVGGVGDRAG